MSTTTTRLLTGYVPLVALSYTAVVLYGLLALVFWIAYFRTIRHKYMLWLCIGTTTMAAGFGARIPFTNSPDSISIYIATTLLTLLSPCAFLAADYYILPRLAESLDAQDCLFLRPRIIGRIFLSSDGFTFFLQSAGGGLTASHDTNMQKLGNTIALIGLTVQCVSFGIYTILLIIFAYKLRRSGRWESSTRSGENWHRLYYALCWTCVGIMIRCIFRVIEFAQGYSGYLRTHEWAYYTFDTLPLFLAILVWAFIWPPRYIGNLDTLIRHVNGSDVPMTSVSNVEYKA